MPTYWSIILGLTCDRCGAFITFEGKSQPEALIKAWAAGWRIESVTVCPECNKEKVEE